MKAFRRVIIDGAIFSETHERGSVTIRADRNTADRPLESLSVSSSYCGGGLPICRRVERQDQHRALLATPSKDLQHENSARLRPELSVCLVHLRETEIHMHARTHAGSMIHLGELASPRNKEPTDRERQIDR